MSKQTYKFEILKKDNYHIYYEDRDDNTGGAIVYKNLKNNEFFERSGKIENLIDFYNSCEMGIINFWHLLPFGKNKNDKNKLILLTDIKSLHADLNEKDSSPENQAQSDTTTPVILTSGVCEDTFSQPNREEIEKVARPSSEESQLDTFKLEAEHQAATAMVEANMAEFHAEQQEIKAKQQQERDELIAEAYKMAGKIEAFKFISNFADVGSLSLLKKIKESKMYKEMPTIKTWDNYCKSIGLSASKVDEDLNNIATFGEKFMTDVGNFGLGYRELRQLKKEIKSGNLEVKDAEVIIDGEVIPLDDKDELRDALDTLLKSKYKEIEELKDEIKNKESIIEDKEHDIKRLQASNNTFFKEKEQAERELKYLKAEGSINGVELEDNPDFQAIKQCENESSILIERLTRLAEKDLSKFNKSMLGSTVIKIMNDMHNLHQELCSLGISDYFGDAFVDDDVIDAEDAVTTPNMFLKQQGNEDE